MPKLAAVKPEITPVPLIVKVPPVDKVPVPDKVPFKVILNGMLGSAPNGKLQLLLIVFSPKILLKATLLKVTLLQESVAAVPLSKVIVPPFALNTGVPLIVKAPAIVIFPLGALNVPPGIIKAPFISAPLGKVKVPDETTLQTEVVAPTQTVEIELKVV